MLKIRVPYSLVLTALSLLAIQTPLVVLVGIITEIIIGIVIYRNLAAASQFEYDSFVGHLLLQYTFTNEVGIMSIIHLICARVAAYAIFGVSIYLGSYVGGVIAVLLFLLTVVHIVHSEQTFI